MVCDCKVQHFSKVGVRWESSDAAHGMTSSFTMLLLIRHALLLPQPVKNHVKTMIFSGSARLCQFYRDI